MAGVAVIPDILGVCGVDGGLVVFVRATILT
jgi:hypothetical protein